VKKAIYTSTLLLIAIIIVFYFKLAGGKAGEFEATDNNPDSYSSSPLSLQSGGWQLQVMPNMGSRLMRDLYFTDSLTGYAVASQSGYADSAHILKTTNGGNNWNIKYTVVGPLRRIIFINSNTGFSCGSYLLKTTNAGENWLIWNWTIGFIEDMQVFGEDTIWCGDIEPITGGIFRTTNSGLNWEKRDNGIPANSYPNKIYFYNSRIGFAYQGGNTDVYKTTNGGTSWFVIFQGGFSKLLFSDSLNGFRASAGFFRTSDGGSTWTKDSLPNVYGNVYTRKWVSNFFKENNDTIYAIGASVQFLSNFIYKGILYKTTNKGINWGYQVPDTSFGCSSFDNIYAINNNVWSYTTFNNKGIYSSTGGDSTIYLGIQNISNEIPKNYILYQNYPNPFNPVTKIKYEITKKVKRQTSNAKLIVYDITGKQISTLVDRTQEIGDYLITFDGSNLSSGIYFYALFADDLKVDTKKAILLK
jgi:photosystem II stability/assembly factor-like uncharacterized protein